MALEGQKSVIKATHQLSNKRDSDFILMIDSTTLTQLSCVTEDIPLIGNWLSSDIFHSSKQGYSSTEAGLIHPRKSFSLSELARQQDAQLMRKWLVDRKQESGVLVLINQVDRKDDKGGWRAVPLLFNGDAFMEGKLDVINKEDGSFEDSLDLLEIRKRCETKSMNKGTDGGVEKNIIENSKTTDNTQSSNSNGTVPNPRRSISFEKAKEAFNCKSMAATTEQMDRRVPPPLPSHRPKLKSAKEAEKQYSKDNSNGEDNQAKSTISKATINGNEARDSPPPPPPKPRSLVSVSSTSSSSSSRSATNGTKSNATLTTMSTPPPPPPPIKEKATIRYGYLRKPDRVGFWVARLVVFDSRQNSLIHACFNRAGALMPPEHIYFRRLTRVQLSIYSSRQFEIDEDESLDVRFDLGQRVSPNRKDFITVHRFLCDDEEDAQEWVALIHSACPELKESSPPPVRPPKPSSTVKSRSLSLPSSPMVGNKTPPVQQTNNVPSIPPRPKLVVADENPKPRNSIVSTMKLNFEKQQPKEEMSVTPRSNSQRDSTIKTNPVNPGGKRESVRFVDQHGKVIPPPPALPGTSQYSRHALSQDGKLVPPPPPPAPSNSAILSSTNNNHRSEGSASFSSVSARAPYGNDLSANVSLPARSSSMSSAASTSTPNVLDRNYGIVTGNSAVLLPPHVAARNASSVNANSNKSPNMGASAASSAMCNGNLRSASVGKPAPPPPSSKANHVDGGIHAAASRSPRTSTRESKLANGEMSTKPPPPPPIPIRRYSEPPRVVSSASMGSLIANSCQHSGGGDSNQTRRRRSRADEDDWARLRAIHQAEVSTQTMNEIPVWMLPRSSRPRDPPPPPARTTRPGFYNGIQSLN